MLTKCQVEHAILEKIFETILRSSHLSDGDIMQQEDIEQKDDATTRASKSSDKSMNNTRDEARRMAEKLIAEEARGNRRSAVNTYLVAAIIGLLVWGAIYFLWRSL